jgi:BirA family transcriptional regulator, biotin operon repressor / biotin---[acetyl-CoA-carboxylase] ligase
MKFKIYRYESVKSTNEVAIKLIKEKKKLSGCVVSNTQTKGKGTHGKTWVSKKGNLFISLFFCLKKKYPPFNEFSIINPIIVSNSIKKYCKRDKVNLKFPNDILLNGKKVSGILQEVITMKSKKFLIVGVGVNINSNPVIVKKYKATNIYSMTKKKVYLEKIINDIVSSYEVFLNKLSLYNFDNFKKRLEKMAIF